MKLMPPRSGYLPPENRSTCAIAAPARWHRPLLAHGLSLLLHGSLVWAAFQWTPLTNDSARIQLANGDAAQSSDGMITLHLAPSRLRKVAPPSDFAPAEQTPTVTPIPPLGSNTEILDDASMAERLPFEPESRAAPVSTVAAIAEPMPLTAPLVPASQPVADKSPGAEIKSVPEPAPAVATGTVGFEPVSKSKSSGASEPSSVAAPSPAPPTGNANPVAPSPAASAPPSSASSEYRDSTPARQAQTGTTHSAPGREGVADGVPTSLVKPRYPTLSIRAREEGTVVLEVEVLADGSVGTVRVVGSPGFPRLEQAAIDAVKLSRFKPAMQDGKPARQVVRQPIQFRLRDQ